MTTQDLKIYLLNFLTFTISFSQVEMALRIFLLVISIVYTLWKLIDKKNENTNKKDNDND
jgi:hypothetical protein